MLENDVAAAWHSLRIAERIVRNSALDQAGQRRRLGQSQAAHVLAEVDLRGLTEAADGETPALAQVDLLA